LDLDDCFKIILWYGQTDVPISGGVGLGASAQYGFEIGCVSWFSEGNAAAAAHERYGLDCFVPDAHFASE
jgi:hypothetical protein